MTSGTSKIGRYEITGELGRGGMGVVYDAHDPALERAVAVKVIRFETESGLNASPDVEARFLREARLAARLQHPCVATVYDAGRDGSSLFLVMERVEGDSLARRLQRGDFPAPAAALRMVAQVADALGAAHAVGIIHRDVKPANILLTRGGDVKVSDFGVAKAVGDSTELTHTGSVLGSPAYMAPEQVQGLELDGRADLFSLGVVLYEILLHRKPFPADTVTTLIYQILHQDPFTDAEALRPLGADLAAFLRWSLAKQPAQRVPDAQTFAARARALAEHPPQLVQTSPTVMLTPRGLSPSPAVPAEVGSGAPLPPVPLQQPMPSNWIPPTPTRAESLQPPLPELSGTVQPGAVGPRARRLWPWLAVAAGLLGLVFAGAWSLRQPPAPPPSLGSGAGEPKGEGSAPEAAIAGVQSTAAGAPASADGASVKEAPIAVGQVVERPVSGIQAPVISTTVAPPSGEPSSAEQAPQASAAPLTPVYEPPAAISNTFRCRKAAEFNVSPEEARVAIDGKDIGIADDWDGSGGGKDYPLTAGSYVSCFALPKYQTACVQLVISAAADDDVCDVDTELDRDRHHSR